MKIFASVPKITTEQVPLPRNGLTPISGGPLLGIREYGLLCLNGYSIQSIPPDKIANTGVRHQAVLLTEKNAELSFSQPAFYN